LEFIVAPGQRGIFLCPQESSDRRIGILPIKKRSLKFNFKAEDVNDVLGLFQ